MTMYKMRNVRALCLSSAGSWSNGRHDLTEEWVGVALPRIFWFVHQPFLPPQRRESLLQKLRHQPVRLTPSRPTSDQAPDDASSQDEIHRQRSGDGQVEEYPAVSLSPVRFSKELRSGERHTLNCWKS